MRKYHFLMLMALAVACSDSNNKSDAYGTFEATEITVSAEVNGTLLKFPVEEGRQLEAGISAGLIDSTNYFLTLQELYAQKQAVAARMDNIITQADVQVQQRANLEADRQRCERLIKDKAIPQKQLDDVINNIKLVDKQIISIQSQKFNVQKDMSGVDRQIDMAKEILSKCRIINPVKGTVIAKYMQEKELAVAGKPIYKIANLDSMYLRAYVSGSQLNEIKTGQMVEILTDKNKEDNNLMKGTITWISPTSEFTPKIIQTKDERVNLVYAVKVLVINNGSLKIGMPGELNFHRSPK
ncbi:MAG: efflux RND transporter periplasmic adaptor subunit [Bacteroidia bacterium]|nr:efflux RND transporter periplasmic adaptor subunit [Bacteroidia bacterium]